MDMPANLTGIRRWVDRAVGLVYPRSCQFCSEELKESERGVICATCLGGVKWIEPPCCEQCALPFSGEITGTFVCGYCQDLSFHFDRTVCACRAEGIVRDSLLRFKYNHQMYFGPHLSDWLLRAAQRRIDWREVDGIVPVPLHPRKKRHREFNQAEYLAGALSNALGVPMLQRALRRVKDTETQTRLGAAERTANLRAAFRVRDPNALAGKRWVLVDDVFTTGATMDACATMLRAAGAQQVIALAVARKV